MSISFPYINEILFNLKYLENIYCKNCKGIIMENLTVFFATTQNGSTSVIANPYYKTFIQLQKRNYEEFWNSFEITKVFFVIPCIISTTDHVSLGIQIWSTLNEDWCHPYNIKIQNAWTYVHTHTYLLLIPILNFEERIRRTHNEPLSDMNVIKINYSISRFKYPLSQTIHSTTNKCWVLLSVVVV